MRKTGWKNIDDLSCIRASDRRPEVRETPVSAPEHDASMPQPMVSVKPKHPARPFRGTAVTDTCPKEEDGSTVGHPMVSGIVGPASGVSRQNGIAIWIRPHSIPQVDPSSLSRATPRGFISSARSGNPRATWAVLDVHRVHTPISHSTHSRTSVTTAE